MEKVTITKVNYKDTDKQGNPLLSKKTGRPYWIVGILTNEYGATWLNGFLPFCPDKWEGTSQEIEVFEEEWQGQTQKKFKLPPKNFGGLSEADKTSIALAVRQSSDALTAVKKLRGDLILSGALKETTSDGNPMPDFAPKEKTLSPEDESLMRSAEEAMK